MRRWSAILTFGVMLLTPLTWGQMRGGSRSFGARSFGSGGRGGFAPRNPGFSRGGFGFSRSPRFNTFFDRRPFFHRPFVRRPFFARSPFYYPGFYGGYSYPVGETAPAAYYADDYGSSYYGSDDSDRRELSSEVDRLSEEVERLREERRSAGVTRVVPKPETTLPTMTVLVFRDKHTQEVQNYAIVGQTLWVFNENRSNKIALASLDVDATTKANDERGVDFQLPR